MNDQDKIAELTAEIDRLGLVLAERQAKIGQLMGEAARAGIAGAAVPVSGALAELALTAALDAYPNPDSKHTSVLQRAASDRIAFQRGFLAASGSVPQLAVPNAVWVLRQISQLKPDRGATAIFMAREGLAPAPAAPLPEQTGPSAEDDPEFDDLIGKLAKTNTSSEWDEGKACREWRDELVAYIDSRSAASPSLAPAQQQEPSDSATMDCPVCGGKGLVGGHVGQAPDSRDAALKILTTAINQSLHQHPAVAAEILQPALSNAAIAKEKAQ